MTKKKEAKQSETEASGDDLRRLVEIDIPRDRQRLKQLTDPTLDRLLREMDGTMMEYISEHGRNLVNVRDWALYNFQQMSQALGSRIEELEDRIDLIQTYGTDTMITPEDAEILTKVIVSAKMLATTLLQGPFPIEARDAQGQEKLGEVLMLAQQAEKILVESTLEEDSEDEDSGEDEDDSSEDASN